MLHRLLSIFAAPATPSVDGPTELTDAELDVVQGGHAGGAWVVPQPSGLESLVPAPDRHDVGQLFVPGFDAPGAGEGMAAPSLAGVAVREPSQLEIVQPAAGEDAALLDAADPAPGAIQCAPPREGSDPVRDPRGRRGTGPDQEGKVQELGPILLDGDAVGPAVAKRVEGARAHASPPGAEPAAGEVTGARGEAMAGGAWAAGDRGSVAERAPCRLPDSAQCRQRLPGRARRAWRGAAVAHRRLIAPLARPPSAWAETASTAKATRSGLTRGGDVPWRTPRAAHRATAGPGTTASARVIPPPAPRG